MSAISQAFEVLARMGKLPGLPGMSTGPIPSVIHSAERYAAEAGIPLTRQAEYAHADPTRGRMIADAYQNMQHAPDDPKVRKAYDAMARETMAQWQAVKQSGLDVDWIPPGFDPYPKGPKQVLHDIKSNNHLWVFPTDQGFGTLNQIADNPLLADSGETIKGKPAVVNDIFRIVHDYFGHGMEGSTFGARGEENAWRAHQRLYSQEALPAVTSETRGQNSWVNFGPHGAKNRANQRATTYADQKVGVMPDWTHRENGMPEAFQRLPEGVLLQGTDPSSMMRMTPRRPLYGGRAGIYGIPAAVVAPMALQGLYGDRRG